MEGPNPQITSNCTIYILTGIDHENMDVLKHPSLNSGTLNPDTSQGVHALTTCCYLAYKTTVNTTWGAADARGSGGFDGVHNDIATCR